MSQLELNPEWSSEIVMIDGDPYLDTTPAALIHPSAIGRDFVVGNRRYTVIGGYRMTTLSGTDGVYRITVEQAPGVVLLPPDTAILLELGEHS